MVDINVQNILGQIVELGFLRIANSTVALAVPPLANVYASNPLAPHLDRWNVTIKYLQNYARYHPDFEGSFFLCLYDGWREMAEPAEETERIIRPWSSYNTEEQAEYFSGVGTVGEPRFYSRLDPSIYVELPHKVLAYNRHWNDSNVLLIPDPEFLDTEFRKFTREVISADIPYAEKIPQILWRGARHVDDGYTYVGEGYEASLQASGRSRIHPRDLACSISSSPGRLTPDIAQFLNASYDFMPVGDMLQSRYLLDLDGMVSAWSGLFWKLYSASAVFKLRSHWEQWYYRDLVPLVHFVPLRNLSPEVVQAAFDWCETGSPQQCEGVAQAGAALARTLTYEYAVKQYVIH